MSVLVISLGISFSPLFAKSDVKADKTAVTQQQYIVTFRIVDESGEGIPGVSVTVKGASGSGAVSDFDGNVRIKVEFLSSISRLGIAHASAALPSAYRKGSFS